MQTKWQCFGVFSGIFAWFTTIVVGIQYQQEILNWTKITPFHMILLAVLVVSLCIYIVMSLQCFRQCPESKKCKHAFRGLSHSRMKKLDTANKKE